MELQPLTVEERDLIQRREEARKAKKWAEADRIRKELQERGLRVFDTATGTRWEHL